MKPDAIIIFSAGIVPLEAGAWRVTTYNESDAFGTLGGRDRVEAGALLARRYPNAFLVTTSRRSDGEPPTLARVYADELRVLGVDPARILEEGNSTNTESAVQEAVRLAQEKNWDGIMFISSEYHLPRVTAFFKRIKYTVTADFVSAESLLAEHNQRFAEYFEKVKKSPAYQKRLASEVRGIKALHAGTYSSALPEDKKERTG